GIINQSRGFIRVESKVGFGTTFSILLPAADPEVDRDTETSLGRAAAAATGSETILVVEDEESVRTVACEILQAKGYRVLEASNGQQALEDCARYEGSIDLLLTDVVMPHMKGTELARRLGSLRPEIKIMYMSGYNEESILGKRLGEAGPILIQKPFSPQSLARRVRDVLDSGRRTT
ncbi:MAG: response regulator, partial [Acidobacteriota bacterium]